MPGGNYGVASVGINNCTLTPHTTVITFEGIPPGTTFEFELMRHFEGFPDDSADTFEREEATLEFCGSALELLRTTELEWILQPHLHSQMTMRGLGDIPLF